jgi:hypothetical protein
MPRSLWKQELNIDYHVSICKELNEKQVALFYKTNVAFNVVWHAGYIVAMKAVSMEGFDYTPPMFHAMKTKHIQPLGR